MLSQPGAIPQCSVDLRHKIDGFLKRLYRYGFTKEIFHIQTIIDSATYSAIHDLTRLKPQTIVSITYYLLNDHSMMHSESDDISLIT